MSKIKFLLTLANYVRKFGPMVMAIWQAVKRDIEIPERFQDIADFLREALVSFRDLADAFLTSVFPPMPVGCGYGGFEIAKLSNSSLKAYLEAEAKKVESATPSKANKILDECFGQALKHCDDCDDPDCDGDHEGE